MSDNEPSRGYIRDYEYDPDWELLGEHQQEIAREREARLHGEVINDER